MEIDSWLEKNMNQGLIMKVLAGWEEVQRIAERKVAGTATRFKQ